MATIKMELDTLDIICKEFDVESIYHIGNIDSKQDIDLVIISQSFCGISIFKRKDLICRINSKIDPICLTLNEFSKLKESRGSLWMEILNNGVLLYGSEKTHNRAN